MSATFWLRKRSALGFGRSASTAVAKQRALAGWKLPEGFAMCEICSADVPIARLLLDPLARRCRRCESSA